MAKRNIHGLSWLTIRLEGSLLVPDLLEMISNTTAPAQKEVDYQIPPGLKMIEEIGRSYQIARALFAELKSKRDNPNIDAFQITDSFLSKFMTSCLGWTDVKKVRPKKVGDYGYRIQKLAFDQVPVTCAPCNVGLDESDDRFIVEGSRMRKRTPFQMVQEYLNAVGKSSWGIVSNGLKIRLLRSSPTMARPQYLEFDLKTMLEDDHYSEYSLMWKVLHVSRIYNINDQIPMSIWETWRNETISSGERVRDGLRDGVTVALQVLGSGFIKHPDNTVLREKLDSGSLSEEELFHQLLRLVYRFLFLFALEERRAENGLRLVFDPDPALVNERDLYEKGYSMDRLREAMTRRSSYTYYSDLWKTQQIVFKALAKGEKKLSLPALGGLFSRGNCDDIEGMELDNSKFLEAIENLRWNKRNGQYTYIDYRNMGTEELGSVYESLLELVPLVDMPARQFRFVGIEDDESTAGNARKTTGSYYTPSFLVDQLIKTALVPVIEQRVADHNEDREEVLLSLKVIDPACGSGHFILAAARKIAEYVAMARDTDGVITPSEYRRALRDVISKCVYGVDLNPMAVELTKMALWLEGYEPGKPLSFLDRHLLCGNSLMGVFDLSILDKGIPNDAFKALTGDDKSYCSELSKSNAIGLKSYNSNSEILKEIDLFSEDFLEDAYISLDSMPEDDVQEVENKVRQYRKLKDLLAQKPDVVSSDIFVGAFLLTKKSGEPVPTSQTLFRYKVLKQPSELDLESIKQAREACKKANILHWPSAFPKVLSEGGFDVVLGNPPWDMLQLDPREYFSKTNPEISNAQNTAKREKLLQQLEKDNPVQFYLFEESLHQTKSFQNFIHCADRFELSGIGRINLSSLFTETCMNLMNKSKRGRAGLIVPSGLCTDSFTQKLFGSIVDNQLITSLFDFENRDKIFPAVDSRQKFLLLTLGPTELADFACFLHSIQELEDDRRHFELTADDFDLINPNTHTLPIFRSKMDAELAKKIYRKNPILINDSIGERGNPWNVSFQLMFMMNTASSLFLDKPDSDSYPLYEAKMVHQYDHRWATHVAGDEFRDVTNKEKEDPTFEVKPRYWIPKKEVYNRVAEIPDNVKKAWYAEEEHQLRNALALCEDEELQKLSSVDHIWKVMDKVLDERTPKWLMGWRDIVRSTDERTLIATVFPRSGVGNTINLILGVTEKYRLLFISNLSCLVFDYFTRQKVGGIHLNHFYFKQLPILQPDLYSCNVIKIIKNYTEQLLATSRNMASVLSAEYHPWNNEERAILRAELDALYARLYGLTREELMFILDPSSVMGDDYPSKTFSGLKNKELRGFGEYRTMRLVLEAWDRQEKEPKLWS